MPILIASGAAARLGGSLVYACPADVSGGAARAQQRPQLPLPQRPADAPALQAAAEALWPGMASLQTNTCMSADEAQFYHISCLAPRHPAEHHLAWRQALAATT